jgi:hypothetical protein
MTRTLVRYEVEINLSKSRWAELLDEELESLAEQIAEELDELFDRFEQGARVKGINITRAE